MFFNGSRYKKVQEYSAIDSKGNYNRVKKLRIIGDVRGILQHMVAESDRLDLISHLYYGDSKLFWLICDANPDMYPEDLLKHPGRRIIIPSK